MVETTDNATKHAYGLADMSGSELRKFMLSTVSFKSRLEQIRTLSHRFKDYVN